MTNSEEGFAINNWRRAQIFFNRVLQISEIRTKIPIGARVGLCRQFTKHLRHLSKRERFSSLLSQRKENITYNIIHNICITKQNRILFSLKRTYLINVLIEL
jgi:hypothetical protein